LLQAEQFIDYAFIRTEANGVSEESRDRAELATVGTTSSGLDRDDAKRAPAFSYFPQHGVNGFGYEIELIKVDRLPGNRGILLQRWLALFAAGVNWRVDLFEFTTDGIAHNERPGFVGFAESHSIGVTRAAIAAKRLIRKFCDVRSAHDYGHASGADRVRHTVSLGDHPSHGPDADQSDVAIADVLC